MWEPFSSHLKSPGLVLSPLNLPLVEKTDLLWLLALPFPYHGVNPSLKLFRRLERAWCASLEILFLILTHGYNRFKKWIGHVNLQADSGHPITASTSRDGHPAFRPGQRLRAPVKVNRPLIIPTTKSASGLKCAGANSSSVCPAFHAPESHWFPEGKPNPLSARIGKP